MQLKKIFRYSYLIIVGFIVKNYTGANIRTVAKYVNINRIVIKYCIEYYLKYQKYRNNTYHDLQEKNKIID